MAGYIGSKASVTLVDGYNRTEADAEFVNDPNEVITVDSSGNVGIATISPEEKLHVGGSIKADFGSANANPRIYLDHDSATDDGNYLQLNRGDDGLEVVGQNNVKIRTNGGERMRIDSSGNLLVGKTSPSIASVGVEMRGSQGILTAASQDANTVYFARKGTAGGSVIAFYKDGTHAGVIGVDSAADLYIGEDTVGLQFQNTGADRIDPYDTDSVSVRDNGIDLGGSSSRFDDIYATNGTIQTSDRNEKQQIAALTDAEMTAAKAISEGFKTFKWNDSVAEKGADAARTHSGVIAQEVEQAMTDAGLAAGDYAFFISTTWWETQTEVPAVEAVDEVLDEDGNVITEAVEAKDAYTRTDTFDTLAEAPEGATERNRKGIRYPQLLSFVGAATEQRLASIETRLAALEGN